MNSTQQGTLVAVTRRYIDILIEGKIVRGTLGSRAMDVCVGDAASVERRGESYVVTEIPKRRNCLVRSYGEKKKRLVANLDHLLIVAAVGELFNTVFIDRVMTVAFEQEIPVSLLVNKMDLKERLEITAPLIDVYRNAGINVLLDSVVSGEGIPELIEKLETPALKIVALAGISGVGKSSILNAIIPDLELKTSAVSAKTGQGKQTTSQAVAYSYVRKSAEPLLLVDLPGIQSFGVSHLAKETLTLAFPEMKARMMQCEFKDCLHRDEENCAVIEAVKNEEIAFFRYESYLGMLAEIESGRKY